MTSRVLAARPFAELSAWLKLLVGYDIVVVLAAFLVFEYTLDE